jgi:hypothetical protein
VSLILAEVNSVLTFSDPNNSFTIMSASSQENDDLSP